MANWLLQRRLAKISSRLRSLRAELQVLDEQLFQMADEADSAGVRALVSDSPEAGRDAREAGAHADAMRRHRAHVVESIADLERRQDELLDQLGS